MNIFYTDPDPVLCAIVLDDSRVIKMTLESAQMLCCAAKIHGQKVPYRVTHAKHPCSIWTAASMSNFLWLQAHGRALAAEYSFRFGRQHASLKVIEELIPCGPRTNEPSPPPNCSAYKLRPLIPAYKFTLIDKWNSNPKKARWTKTQPPSWYTNPIQLSSPL